MGKLDGGSGRERQSEMGQSGYPFLLTESSYTPLYLVHFTLVLQ